ncbi:formate/nitrite transporter family protein [Cellulomonas sp. IC4_254]|uniref:formate/nitrite transporter family protein n=1 Tax=Cellulomonas sp. IC4_254 TaxID=2714040 RepID=UPI00142426BE|nr:formate/nitrite transporter family protein [Cellulomonas sp. IC4_254]NHT19523.1 formate/nitrite transporter family protein [Cellulomonas sp. IC4_254]
MLSVAEALDYQTQAARTKTDLARRPGVYLVNTMLAGAYIGLGVVIMATAGGPLADVGSGFTPLVQGLVFGVALTIVVVAGGELATSAMMVFTQGAMRGAISWARAGATLLACLAGNLLGAFVLAVILHLSGALGPDRPAGRMIASMIAHKSEETGTELFFRGVMCNLMVCLAIWCAGRLQNEVAKIVVIFACVMVFITSGFEHVVANMTTFSFGLVGGIEGATVAEFARNVLLVGLGNLVGGGLLVGAANAVAAAPARVPATPAAPTTPAAVEPAGATPEPEVLAPTPR